MELNRTLTDIEKCFNVAGSIPGVALVSSLIRMTASKTQVFAGLVFGLIGLIGQLVSANQRKYQDLTHKAGEQVIHGFLNAIRALGELLLGLTIVGTLGLLAYQSCSERKFAPLIPYDLQQRPQPAIVA